MFYWIFILLGIVILTFSISTPFYNLTIKKILNLKIIFIILFRLILFFIGFILIFVGLYLESLN